VSVAVTATGAFRQVQTHELLSQEQLDEALKLAGNAALACRPPASLSVREHCALTRGFT
jgi:hypothetical protein